MKYEQKVSIHINKSNKLLAQNAKIKQENKTTKHKTQNTKYIRKTRIF